MIEAVLSQFITELNRVRSEKGEEAYLEAAKISAKMAISQGGLAEKFMREALKGIIDFDAVEREMAQEAASLKPPAPPEPSAPKAADRSQEPVPPADEQMAKTIMSQVPGCHTQAQFNAMMACFDALRLLVNAIFTGADTTDSRKALDQALEAAAKATEISNKLKDVPEACTSAVSEDFKQPPKQFHEHDVQRALLNELQMIQTREMLNEWYATNRSRIDQVVSPTLRNALFDLIRSKKDALPGQLS